MSLANAADLHAGEHPRAGDTYVWERFDGIRVYVRVTRVSRNLGVAWLRCHQSGRSWTRRHELPLFDSMIRRPWTTAELLDTVE